MIAVLRLSSVGLHAVESSITFWQRDGRNLEGNSGGGWQERIGGTEKNRENWEVEEKSREAGKCKKYSDKLEYLVCFHSKTFR